MAKINSDRFSMALGRFRSQFRQKEPVYLGQYICDNGDGTHDVYVLNPDMTPGPRRAVRGRCRSWPGVIVRLSEDHQRFREHELVIMGVAEEEYGSARAPSMLEDHGPDHGYNQIDEIMNLYTWQLYPLRAQPYSGMTVRVLPGLYYADGAYHQLDAASDVDLTADKPAANYCYVTLSIDAAGTVNTTKGSDVASPTAEDIPDAPMGERPIAAVLLHVSDTSVPRTRFTADLRYMVGSATSGGGGGALWENVIIVAKSGGQYDVVQDAIDAAVAGDCVLVMPGTYVEDIDMKQGVSVVGVDRENTIIQGPGTNLSDVVTYAGTVGSTLLSNITLTNTSGVGVANLYGIVNGSTGTNWLHNVRVVVTNTGAGATYGVSLTANGTMYVDRCESAATGAATNIDGYTNSASAVLDIRHSVFPSLNNAAGTLSVSYVEYTTVAGTITYGDPTAILASLLTVDGTGSGLDADLLDGKELTELVEKEDFTAAIASFLALPALRAFWPMSSVDYAAATQARDVSGGAYHLVNNNSADFGYETLIPCVDFVAASTQYLSLADGGAANWADITGTEAYIPAAQQGMTIGGWFKFDGIGAINNIMGKWAAAGQTSYYLQRRAGNDIQFGIHDGVGTDVVTSSVTIAADTWYFIVGRFDPSTSVDVFVNGTWDTNAVGIGASILDSTAAFTIGVLATLANYMDGKASMCFLCACDMSDAIVEGLFNQTRELYGV